MVKRSLTVFILNFYFLSMLFLLKLCVLRDMGTGTCITWLTCGGQRTTFSDSLNGKVLEQFTDTEATQIHDNHGFFSHS